MNNKPLIQTTPIFIPKIYDKTIKEMGISFPALLMESPHVDWHQGVRDEAAKLTNLLIIDPVTSHLLYPNARKKVSYKKLPYPADINSEELFSSQVDRLEKVIKPSINDQISKGASIIIAPYFFAVDTDDFKFNLNLTFLSETITYLEKNNIDTPIFANIALGKEALHRSAVLKYIIDLYKDKKELLSGYFICINDFNAEKADLDQLNGISFLVFNLSDGNDVFVKYAGGFGEVLCAIGASGFTSGLDGGEIFSVKNFEKRTKGFGRIGSWTYVSEIFDHVNDTELKKIGYICNCPYCRGGLPLRKKEKKLHYLFKKMEAMKAQEHLTRSEKIDYMSKKIQDAIKQVEFFKEKYAVPLSSYYLQNWLKVLENAKNWKHEKVEDTEELNKLLEELRS